MSPTNVESSEDADAERRVPNAESPGPVAVEGRERVVVSAPQLGYFPREVRTCTIECASGVRATDEWTGVPVETLAEAADFPGETTHLRVEADDFAADVPIRAALDGILAFDRRGGRDDDEFGLPRLVADDVPGERLVKRVERLSAVALDAGEEPRIG